MRFTPALLGSSISVHPLKPHLISVCEGETVQFYDLRKCGEPLFTRQCSRRSGTIGEYSEALSSLSYNAGATWSKPTGRHFAVCERDERKSDQGYVDFYFGRDSVWTGLIGTDSPIITSWPRPVVSSWPPTD